MKWAWLDGVGVVKGVGGNGAGAERREGATRMRIEAAALVAEEGVGGAEAGACRARRRRRERSMNGAKWRIMCR